MEELLKYFPHATTRNYKGGIEIRTGNLENDYLLAARIIKDKNLDLEIFDKDAILKSFSVREKK